MTRSTLATNMATTLLSTDSKAVSVPAETAWSDPKRYAWLLGLTIPLLPFTAGLLVELTGLGIMWWWGPVAIFLVFPAVDMLAGLDDANPPEALMDWLEEDRYYRFVTYLFIPLQYLSLVWACWIWAYGDLTTIDKIGLAATVGMVSGISIVVAHELGHKRPKHERWFAKVTLAQPMYGHFFVEHNRGHHARVATPEDPASSRMGESFWAFLPRTVTGSLRSAWALEHARFERLGRSQWSPRNDVLNAWAMTAALYGGLSAIFGVEIFPYLLIQGVLGFCLLEVVNYLEHYGLLRQKLDSGRYEHCRPEHSWNSCSSWSNIALYHLQRHSDHHANPTRRYQALLHVEEAPQLPAGYASMILLAMFPPVWRRVMDRRLVTHYGGDLALANIAPRARKRIAKRYPADSTARGERASG